MGTQLDALRQALAAESGDSTSSFEGGKWADGVVSWSFSADPESEASSSYAQFVALAQQAFQTWAAPSELTFQQVPDSPQADIRLTWSQLNTTSTGVLGYTTVETADGQMLPGAVVRLEDPAQLGVTADANGQLAYSGTQAEVLQVLLHEIGHALGLGDNPDVNSIMYPFASASNRTLDATDLKGIASLYGAGSTAPSSASGTQGSDGKVLAALSSLNELILSNVAAFSPAASATGAAPGSATATAGLAAQLAPDQLQLSPHGT